jgi:DNA-directed RNA polymerase subunit RPC12/RpoP
MSIFNKKLIKAMLSREYVCPECGKTMIFEDEWEDTLVCENCGHSVDLDSYGAENDEEYDNLYPSEDSEENDDDNEPYDEVCGELDD